MPARRESEFDGYVRARQVDHDLWKAWFESEEWGHGHAWGATAREAVENLCGRTFPEKGVEVVTLDN